MVSTLGSKDEISRTIFLPTVRLSSSLMLSRSKASCMVLCVNGGGANCGSSGTLGGSSGTLGGRSMSVCVCVIVNLGRECCETKEDAVTSSV